MGVVCANDPVNAYDPLGLDKVKLSGKTVYWETTSGATMPIGALVDKSTVALSTVGTGVRSLRMLKSAAKNVRLTSAGPRLRDEVTATLKWGQPITVELCAKIAQITQDVRHTVGLHTQAIVEGESSLVEWLATIKLHGKGTAAYGGLGVIAPGQRPSAVVMAMNRVERWRYMPGRVGMMGLGVGGGIVDILLGRGTEQGARDFMTMYLMTEAAVHIMYLAELQSLQKACEKAFPGSSTAKWRYYYGEPVGSFPNRLTKIAKETGVRPSFGSLPPPPPSWRDPGVYVPQYAD